MDVELVIRAMIAEKIGGIHPPTEEAIDAYIARILKQRTTGLRTVRIDDR